MTLRSRHADRIFKMPTELGKASNGGRACAAAVEGARAMGPRSRPLRGPTGRAAAAAWLASNRDLSYEQRFNYQEKTCVPTLRAVILMCALAAYASGCGEDGGSRTMGAGDGGSRTMGAGDGGSRTMGEGQGGPEGPAGGRSDCENYCARGAATGCELYHEGGCLSACILLREGARGACDDEFTSYLECHADATYHCMNGRPWTDDCGREYGQVDNCAFANPRICNVPADVSACEVCVAENCCVPRESCDAGCQAYMQCREPCNDDTACKTACGEKVSPATLGIGVAYAVCKERVCKDECSVAVEGG